jgi:hypothetical protein
MGLDDPQKDVQDGTDGVGLALQIPAQAFWHREDPLAHRQRRDDMIDQMRGGLRHAAGVARRAYRAAFARERHEEVMPAVRTSGPGEAVGQDAAFEVVAKFPFHVGGHPLPVPVVFACQPEVGLQVLLDDLVKDGVLGMAAAVRGGLASLRGDGHVGVRIESTRKPYMCIE